MRVFQMSEQRFFHEEASLESDLAIVIPTSQRNAYDANCPYLGNHGTCKASLSTLVPTVKARKAFCNNEDYDDCPIFLSKILRRRLK